MTNYISKVSYNCPDCGKKFITFGGVSEFDNEETMKTCMEHAGWAKKGPWIFKVFVCPECANKEK